MRDFDFDFGYADLLDGAYQAQVGFAPHDMAMRWRPDHTHPQLNPAPKENP